ncbi:signal peptidase II [Chloroflexota bacterium]
MQKASSVQDKWRQNLPFSLITLLIVAADHLSKVWVRSYPEGETIFEAGFFQLNHISNTGAAFGLFQGQSFALTIVALIGVGALLFYAVLVYRRFPLLNSKLGKSALSLILGGTIGNLIDRLLLGRVTDFIDFGFWPAFNVADSAITVGVILFAYSFLLLSRAKTE